MSGKLRARTIITRELFEQVFFPDGVRVLDVRKNPDYFVDGRDEIHVVVEGDDVPGSNVEGDTPPLITPMYESHGRNLAPTFKGWTR